MLSNSSEDFEDAPPANSPRHVKQATTMSADETAMNEEKEDDDFGKSSDFRSVDTTLQTEPSIIIVKSGPLRF